MSSNAQVSSPSGEDASGKKPQVASPHVAFDIPEKSSISQDHLQPSPEDTAGLFSRLTFSWLNAIIALGSKKYLEMSDLWKLPKDNQAHTISHDFNKVWTEEKKRPAQEVSLLHALHLTFGKKFYMAGILKFVNDIAQVVSPLFVYRIIDYIQYRNQETYMGYVWVILLLAMQLASTICINQYFHTVMTIGMRMRGSLIASIYQKSLRLSHRARQSMTTGEMVNLISTDSQKIMDLMTYLHMTWSGLVQVAACLGFLFYYLGVSTIAGLAMMILLFPAQGKMARKIGMIRRETLKHTDQRVKTMNEILQGIKVIKFYAWEDSFLAKLLGLRATELGQVRAAAVVRSINSTIMMISPLLVSLVTYLMYAGLGNALSPAVIFTSLAYFTLLRFPMMFVPMIVAFIVEARVSIDRIQKFLSAEELPSLSLISDSNTNVVSRGSVEETNAIEADNCNFTWGAPLPVAPAPGAKPAAGATGSKPGSPAAAAPAPAAAAASSSSSSSSSAAASDKPAAVEEDKPLLTNISFKIPRGSLVMICGPVGSGKSSLLQGLLGEMKCTSGSIHLNGSVAYATQQAWIQNATLRDNVIFGLPFEADKYHRAIVASALERDFDMLPNGDQTEIGEKGINLSGGQKQRVSIARAVYANTDIVMFDDPLSAVDPHVGRHIFEQCLQDELRNKTRILVTHQLQYLSHADMIFVLKNGTIAEQGTYQQLQSNKDSEFAAMVNRHIATLSESEQAEEDSKKEAKSKEAKDESAKPKEKKDAASPASPTSPTPANKSLMQVEERATGSVDSTVYKAYLNSAYGRWRAVLLLTTFVISQVALVGSNWWLALWSYSAVPGLTLGGYMGIYVFWAFASAIFQLIRDWVFFSCGLRASRILHENAFRRLLRAPMSFFDTTPLGRIVTRFSKDVDSIDVALPDSLKMTMNCAFIVFSTFLVITVITPLFLTLLAPCLYVYWRVADYYRRSSRELKRLDSTSRSPVFAHFSETLGGLATIRAYGLARRFAEENLNKLDDNHRAYFVQIVSQRWLAFRLELVGLSILFSASLFAVIARDSIPAGLAGLSLTSSLQITALLTWLVRQISETESQFNAVERLVHYANELPQEAPELATDMPNGIMADAKWPAAGAVSFEKVVMRYREGLDPVLKGVSFDIAAGKKIGIVGRTGSGKSTCMIALFRLVELSGGRIVIDGVDISRIGLKDLRKKLSIIPQDPVLFSGTVRFNLDPFHEYSDDQVWDALRSSYLYDSIKALAGELEAPVSEGGENFSVGQRQLICLCRAILRKSKIIILDEATANIDMETDQRIQASIRSSFAHSTILTIAHRLQTVIDYDKILCLKDGDVAEYGSPKSLAENPECIFSSMIDETGSASARSLRQSAKGGDDSVESQRQQAQSSELTVASIQAEIAHQEEENSQLQPVVNVDELAIEAVQESIQESLAALNVEESAAVVQESVQESEESKSASS